ncbi:MAG: hypothetical protein A2293_05935 [Elusimicrobia bacterium RIFOXYB2_FULL_49_7]|nr:MAG: hypothetical protein A2293_05935 [Elusimicrobia bacterium RIFOXYB2_FULL_49_7]
MLFKRSPRSYNAVRDRKETVEADDTLEDTRQEKTLEKLIAVEEGERLQEAMGRFRLSGMARSA